MNLGQDLAAVKKGFIPSLQPLRSISAQSWPAPMFCGIYYCLINLLSLFMLLKQRGGFIPFDLEFTQQTQFLKGNTVSWVFVAGMILIAPNQ